MTALSSLVGGGGQLGYISGVPYWPLMPNSLSAVLMDINEDWMIPFRPRTDLTISHVSFVRANATAANVYVGVYNASGTLLTDCAVDSDTTAGVHEVSTTNVALSPDNLYYIAANQSAAVIACDQFGGSNDANFATYYERYQEMQADPGLWTSLPNSSALQMGPRSKARSNAVMPSSQTMTGWGSEDDGLALGVTPV